MEVTATQPRCDHVNYEILKQQQLAMEIKNKFNDWNDDKISIKSDDVPSDTNPAEISIPFYVEDKAHYNKSRPVSSTGKPTATSVTEMHTDLCANELLTSEIEHASVDISDRAVSGHTTPSNIPTTS